MIRLIHAPSGRALATGLEVARTARERMRGLLGRDGLPPGGGLLIERCSSIHTCFMRFSLDVLFTSEDLSVWRVEPGVAPWRLLWSPGARHAIELPAGVLRDVPVAPGDRLRLEETAG